MAREVDEMMLHELLYQALETEQGGIKVYTAAIEAAVNDDLRSEWEEYLEQTYEHRDALLAIFEGLGLDPEKETPGRAVCAHLGESLVAAIRMAATQADAEAAERVAAECVVLAETKDHLNWELIGQVIKKSGGPLAALLKEAHEKVEQQEDHHLYHTKGWTRELWIHALGFEAVLPPPEELKQVESAIAAARAEQSRDAFLSKSEN